MQALNYQQAVVSTNPSMTGSQSSSVDGSNGAESQYLTEFYPPPSLPELPAPPTNDAVTAHALLNLSSSNQSAEQESNDPSGLSQPFPPQDGVAHSHELEGISGTAAGMDGLAPSSSAIAAPAPALGSASAVARAPPLAASTNSAASANGQGNIGHAAAVQQPPSHPNMSMNNNHNMAFAPSANEAAATPSASNGYATPMQMMMPGYLNLPQQFPGPQFFQAQNQFQAQQGQFQPQQASPFPFMNQNFFPFPQMMQQGGMPVMPNVGMGMAPNGTDIMSQVNAFNNYMANSTAAQAATPVTAAPYATSAAKIVNTPASNNETQAKPRKRSLSNGGSKTTKKPSPTQAKNSAKPQVASVCSKKKDNSAKGDGSTQAKRPRHNLLVNASNKIAKTTNDPNIKNAAKNSSTEIEKASLSDYNENLNQSAPGYEESVGPQEQEATFRIPCPRRGMTTYHNSKVGLFLFKLSFVEILSQQQKPNSFCNILILNKRRILFHFLPDGLLCVASYRQKWRISQWSRRCESRC